MLENGINVPIHMIKSQRKDKGCDVLLTGRYSSDLIITGLPEMPRLGNEVFGKHCELVPGASVIPAVALQRLGVRVAWPCTFGNDPFSRFVREYARREGVNGLVSRIRSSNAGDHRLFLLCRGACLCKLCG
jgi:sugar/nucleoside kinase (ribokinase family)